MNLWKFYLSPRNWKHYVSGSRLIGAFLAGMGALSAIITSVPNEASETLRNANLLLPSGLMFAALVFTTMRPRISVKSRIEGSDIEIEIRVCNAFEVQNAALVVPINERFDTTSDTIRRVKDSIQCQLITKYYDDDHDRFAQAIEEQLSDYAPGTIYKLGKVITVRPNGRPFYLLASSHFKNNGRASATWNETRAALARLWIYVKNEGDKGTIVIPLIGTGYARTSVKREQIVMEIINSFARASKDKCFCNKLIIAIRPQDVPLINLPELGSYLQLFCRYSKLD